MAGVGKILKQAQKMQKQIEQVQAQLADHDITVSNGGGAVQIVVNGAGAFQSLKLDPEFLKEDPELISETILEAVREASARAKAYSDEQLGSVTSGFGLPGLM